MSRILTIREILQGYRRRELSALDVFQQVLENLEYWENPGVALNAFITRGNLTDLISQLHEGSCELPVAHKDIYSTKGFETTAGSNILRGYLPAYDATSVARLKKAGFLTVGKLNCDAFAHGSTGENSDFGPTRNPYHLAHVAGGSSSGSAAAVAAGIVPVATATDTGGSIRVPAAFTNTVGIKPTYGRVSRYGVIAMTSSTDSIGHITRTVWDNAYVLNVTAGPDHLDATTGENVPPVDYLAKLEYGVKGVKIGLPKEYLTHIDPAVRDQFQKAHQVFEQLGAEFTEVSLPHTEYGINAYYIITPSEVSSNLARFDGIRYGHGREQFGSEAKRRIMIGTYCLSAGFYDAYYRKAQKVRTLIKRDFEHVFAKVDVLMAPVCPVLSPKIGELLDDPVANYMLDALMVPANLAGVPALAIPAGFSHGLPVGIQIIGPHFSESLLYQVGYAFEQETQYYKQSPNLPTVITP